MSFYELFKSKHQDMSNSFHFLIGFLRVNWSNMLILLLFWHSQAINFFCLWYTDNCQNDDLPSDFRNSETSHLCFLDEETQDSYSLFSHASRYSSVSISSAFLKALVDCFENFRHFREIICVPYGCLCLTHSFPVHPFSLSWKHQKTVRFFDGFRR